MISRTIGLALAFFVLTAFSTTSEIQELIRAEKLEQAFRLAEQRAAAGDHEAEEALAWFYEEGKFVAEDDARALSWYRKAAQAGLRHAQWRLGVMLDLGEGSEADPTEAFRWISKSAEQGYAAAFVSMGVMHAMGRGTPEDFVQSRAWYLRAARAGEPHGFFGIGTLHALGQGVRRDFVEAFAWFMVARLLGDTQAKPSLDAAAKQLKKGDVGRAEKRVNEILREFGLSKQIRFETRRGGPDRD